MSAAGIHVENAGSDKENCDMSKLYAVMKKGEKIAEAQLDDSNKIVGFGAIEKTYSGSNDGTIPVMVCDVIENNVEKSKIKV